MIIKPLIRIIIITTMLIALTASAVANDLRWTIRGVSVEMQENIDKRLDTARSFVLHPKTQQDLTQFKMIAERTTASSMQPFGYFHPKINVTYRQRRRHTELQINIKPGPVTRYHRVKVEIRGEGRAFYRHLEDDFKIHVRDPLNIPLYQTAKSQLFSELQTRGYVKAKIAQNVLNINRKLNTAELILIIDTGPRYYFGEVYFSDSPISRTLLKRYIPFKAGEPFSTADLLKFQDALMSSHYFTSVDIEPSFEKAKHQTVPIHVELHARKSKLYLVGIGYSTDIGPRATLGIDWRRINALGHRLQAVIKGSLRYYDFQARYMIPGQNPETDVLTFSSSVFHHKVGQLNSNGFIAGVNSTVQWHSWQRTLGLQYLRETSFDPEATSRTTSWLYPSLTLKKVHANNEINTDHGYRLLFNTQGASKQLLGNADFWQVQLDGKFIHTFKTKTRVLLHGILGATGVNDINNLAPALQFYAGGSQSIRGFEYQGLGPGKFLLLGRVEVQQTFYKDWAIAGFFDVGNAFDRWQHPQIKKSIGIGIVRRSPVGSINVGVAQALDHAQKGSHLVISFGPDL